MKVLRRTSGKRARTTWIPMKDSNVLEEKFEEVLKMICRRATGEINIWNNQFKSSPFLIKEYVSVVRNSALKYNLLPNIQKLIRIAWKQDKKRLLTVYEVKTFFCFYCRNKIVWMDAWWEALPFQKQFISAHGNVSSFCLFWHFLQL